MFIEGDLTVVRALCLCLCLCLCLSIYVCVIFLLIWFAVYLQVLVSLKIKPWRSLQFVVSFADSYKSCFGQRVSVTA